LLDDKRMSSPLESDPIEQMASIVRQYIRVDTDQPISPFRSPAELAEHLDLSIDEQGQSVETVMGALAELAAASPRSTSKRFYNQLIGGRDPMATAADMLVPVLNASLYTFKAAGAMALMEEVVINRMAEKIGFPLPGAQGTFTAGGSISNLMGMLLARNEACPHSREEGIGGVRFRCYVSADAHYSVSKAAGVLGIGRANAQKVPTNDAGEMRLDVLAGMIASDRAQGYVPGIIIATAGTTVLAAFDPIAEIANIARKEKIWLHVDASYGGSALMSPEHSHLLEGVHHADSVAWNPHKAMGVPLSCAAFITRKPELLRRSLDEAADYLFQGDSDRYDPGQRSLQCGRRNDALKVWAAWKHHGDAGYRERIDGLMAVAKHLAKLAAESDRTRLVIEPAYLNTCFEVIGKSSQQICEELRTRNQLLVGHAVVDGRTIIRVPFVNGDIRSADVDEMFGLILDVAASLPAGENSIAAASA
jgi:glutamate/tyrosine decarboxylase-like PLP-dependent enzyme